MQCTLACCCDPISESKVIPMSCCGTGFPRDVWSFHSTSNAESGGQRHPSLPNERSGQGCRLHWLAAAGLPSLASSCWQHGSIGAGQPQEGCCRAFSFWEPEKKEDDD